MSMSTVSFKIDEDELKILKEYLDIKKISLSNFVRELIQDKLDDEISPEEEKRILKIWNESKKEKGRNFLDFLEEERANNETI
ncbi:DUF6290 family protein [Oceanivirga salmonicida]|uniref:DUF6290 family protein n=1 Tax=Oceanivirga salmonicida TaxID=1769291 RepID=UPI001E634B24|nr:DUF6290 family protein [Oceanivirga salmonicida]